MNFATTPAIFVYHTLSAYLYCSYPNKKIANWYNFDGSVKDENESAAVYALAARLFWLNNDSKYALWCYSKVLAFQIEDVSDFGGGFGDQDSGMVYAFDQLEALLMLRMVQGIGE